MTLVTHPQKHVVWIWELRNNGLIKSAGGHLKVKCWLHLSRLLSHWFNARLCIRYYITKDLSIDGYKKHATLYFWRRSTIGRVIMNIHQVTRKQCFLRQSGGCHLFRATRDTFKTVRLISVSSPIYFQKFYRLFSVRFPASFKVYFNRLFSTPFASPKIHDNVRQWTAEDSIHFHAAADCDGVVFAGQQVI